MIKYHAILYSVTSNPDLSHVQPLTTAWYFTGFEVFLFHSVVNNTVNYLQPFCIIAHGRKSESVGPLCSLYRMSISSDYDAHKFKTWPTKQYEP